MEPMGYLVFGLIMGGAVAAIANSKGRSPVGWFFVGFFFGIIGLIVVLVSSNLNQEKYARARQDEENRRLREQLRQERIKHETLREYTMRRLDAHDQVLGLDTRALQALPTDGNQNFLPGADPASAQPAATPQPEPAPRSNAWYFEQNGETRGPVTTE